MWSLTLYAGNWEVIFGFLPARMGFNSPWRSTRDLVFPEEGHHEGLFRTRAPSTHQTYPACGQWAVWGGVGVGRGERMHSVGSGTQTCPGNAACEPSKEATFFRLHVKADAQIAAGLEEPVVGGGGDVEGQPALLTCSHWLHIQQHQLWLPGKARKKKHDRTR